MNEGTTDHAVILLQQHVGFLGPALFEHLIKFMGFPPQKKKMPIFKYKQFQRILSSLSPPGNNKP